MTTATDTAPDTEAAVEQFAGKFLGDLAAVLHAGTVVLGDKLGLYRALVELGPTTPEALAAHTGCDPRYVREWLSAQAASEYCHYDPMDGTFHLDEAQATCLADESSPAFLVGGMAVASSVHKDEDTLTARFRTGEGVGWHEHHHDLFVGTERFFRPAYAASSSRHGCPPSTVSSPSSRRVGASPTSAAATAPRRSSSPRPSRRRRSPASTTTRPRS